MPLPSRSTAWTDDTSLTAREVRQLLDITPSIAALIAININAVTVQIDNVGCPRAINIRETETFLIELILSIEPGRVVHGHLGAKTAVAQIRPVTHFTVANAHDVSEAVTGKVCEKDSLSGICESDYYGTFFLVARLANPDRLAEPLLLQCRMPDQSFVLQ